MFHYLYTNDMRITNLESSLIEAAQCIRADCVPSSTDAKSKNNNMKTLGDYFNLKKDNNCTKQAAAGNARKVVLNFIKKFQFPNPRTLQSLQDCMNDGICLAPLRTILKILYIMSVSSDDAYLSLYEIYNYIFFNDKIAKNKTPNFLEVIENITRNRVTGSKEQIPDDDTLQSQGKYWNQCKRQIREMVQILLFSGYVTKDEAGNFKITDDNLTRDNKADIFEVLSYSDYWEPDTSLQSIQSESSNEFKQCEINYEQYMDIDNSDCDDGGVVERPVSLSTGFKSEFSHNRVVFGAPGTGKSFKLNRDRETLIGKDNESDYERVTFHPDYSYANFVGTYKPVPYKDENGKDLITYEYVPGPFMRIYVKALKNLKELKNEKTETLKPFLLLIEEINRANVAAVFGDIFQLLDRDDTGVSEYPIQATEDIKAYLAKELDEDSSNCEKIRIPENLYIWATMNSADQGVFPMDTAFKRRWDFTYIGIDDNEELIRNKKVVLGNGKNSHRVEWNELRKAINNFLADKGINEDKQLGPYFIARNIVVPKTGNEIDSKKFIQTFKNKVIMYLFEDAAKHKRPLLFAGCDDRCRRYSEICKEFDENGIEIFNREIQSNVKREEANVQPENELPDMTESE